MINLFRRKLGINTLPFELEVGKGMKVRRTFGQLVNLLWLKVKSERAEKDDDYYIDSLMKLLLNCLDHPRQFGQELQDFVREFQPMGAQLMEPRQIEEIQNRISRDLSAPQRAAISQTAQFFITRFAKGLYARPFVQSMCGSSAKSSLEKNRSFNIYRFEMNGRDCNVASTRYTLPISESDTMVEESSNSHYFAGIYKLPHN